MAKRRFAKFLRERLSGDRCIYCGSPKECEDHFPPYSSGNQGYLLPCCLECNSIIGTQAPFDLIQRQSIAQAGLRRKHRKVLALPAWTEDEINSIEDERMRQGLRYHLELLDELQTRLDWDLIAYLSTIDPDDRLIHPLDE